MVLCGVEPPPLVLSLSALIVRARFPALAPLPPLLVGTRQLTDGLDTAANEDGSEVEPEVEPEEGAKADAVAVAELDVDVEADTRQSEGRLQSSRPTLRLKRTKEPKRWRLPKRAHRWRLTKRAQS